MTSRYDSRNKLIALALAGMMMAVIVPLDVTEDWFNGFFFETEYSASPDHIEPENGSDKAEPEIEASTTENDTEVPSGNGENAEITTNPEENLPAEIVTPVEEETDGEVVDEPQASEEVQEEESPKDESPEPLEHLGDAEERTENDTEPAAEETDTVRPTEPAEVEEPLAITPAFATSVIFVSYQFEHGYLEVDMGDSAFATYFRHGKCYDVDMKGLCEYIDPDTVWYSDISLNNVPYNGTDRTTLGKGDHLYLLCL